MLAKAGRTPSGPECVWLAELIRQAMPLSAVGEYWYARSGRRMMGRMTEGRTLLYAACFALAVLGAARTDPGSRGSSAQARTAGPSGAAVTVGSFGFPKSALGARELVDQALMNGLVQLVPGYADRRWFS
jgi:hypothetical protein